MYRLDPQLVLGGPGASNVWELVSVQNGVLPDWARAIVVDLSPINTTDRLYGFRGVGWTLDADAKWTIGNGVAISSTGNCQLILPRDVTNSQIEIYKGTNTFFYSGNPYEITARIVGYFGEEYVPLTPQLLTTTQSQQWETFSYTAPGGRKAQAVVLLIRSSTLGYRAKGVTVDFSGPSNGGINYVICPVNSAGEFEVMVNTAGDKVYLTAYIQSGLTLYSAPVAMSGGGTSGFGTPTPAVAADKIPLIMVKGSGSGFTYNYFTSSAGTEQASQRVELIASAIGQATTTTNASGNFKSWRNAPSGTSFWVLGYFELAGTPADTQQYPAKDVSNTSWNPSVANASLSEMLLDDPTDGSRYIYATAVGAICEVRLPRFTDPVSSTGHAVKVRMGTDEGNRTIKVYLIQNTTTIASWTQAVTGTVTMYTFELSGAQADSITDYTNLRLRFEVTA